MGNMFASPLTESRDDSRNERLPQRYIPHPNHLPYLYDRYHISQERLTSNYEEIKPEVLQQTIIVPFPGFFKVTGRISWKNIRRSEWKIDLKIKQVCSAHLTNGLEKEYTDFLQRIGKDTVSLTLIHLERTALEYFGLFQFPNVQKLTVVIPDRHAELYTDHQHFVYRFNLFDIIEVAFPLLTDLKIEGFRPEYGRYRAFVHNLDSFVVLNEATTEESV